jgi:arginine decarboxylase
MAELKTSPSPTRPSRRRASRRPAAPPPALELEPPSASLAVEPVKEEPWTTEDSLELYSIPSWGQGYFGISEKGHLVVFPDKRRERGIDLYDVVEGLKARQIMPPVLLRFPDLLDHRISELAGVFRTAMRENDYKGEYICVYPTKVNPQQHVVEEILSYGRQYGFGLEAGTKPELLAVMGMTSQHPDTMIVCNGFKDDEYIEAVVLAQKIGRRIVPVVEKFSELVLMVKYAQKHNVRPTIGVRVKLSAPGVGRWQSSGGVRSKFGLFISEVIDCLQYLKDRNMEDCLQMLHCHLGSQICDIAFFKNAINELAHVYTELCRMGAGLRSVDIGGGLGVDYDGSQTNFDSSMNYTIAEYAADVVYRIGRVCDENDVPHPTIMSESGRALVAFSSVMVTEVSDVSGFDRFEIPTKMELSTKREEIPQPLITLYDTYNVVKTGNLIELYHDAVQARDEALNLFNLGYLDLELRSVAERLFWAICSRILRRAQKLEEMPEELAELPGLLSDTYFCNFSVFQSMPDSWAIDQLFPVVPIHRLEEYPTRRAVLADITCDSDGKIDRFVDRKDVKRSLEVHELRGIEPYYLGIFLLGAYQEILGDLHNLLGDTHAVHIRLDEDGQWSVDEFIAGDTLTEVLEYVQYEPKQLQEAIRKETELAVQKGRLTLQESTQLFNFYRDGLNGYTYLERYEEEPPAQAHAAAAVAAVAIPANGTPVPPSVSGIASVAAGAPAAAVAPVAPVAPVASVEPPAVERHRDHSRP